MNGANSNDLKYMQVESAVRDLINGAEPGDKLPTERELARKLGCHVLTVRKGLKPLVDQGLLTRRVGSGTFVSRGTSDSAEPGGNGRGLDHIGLLLNNSGSLYSYRLVRTLADETLKMGIHLRSAWSSHLDEEALHTVQDMAKSGCQALILPWYPATLSDTVAQFVQQSPVPVVLPEVLPGLEHLCFEMPEVFGTSTALEIEAVGSYFKQLGYKRIHFIGPDNMKMPVLQQKIAAYASFASRENIEVKFGLFGDGQKSVSALAKQESAFAGDLAIISYDDAHAGRFMTAMQVLGLNAPRDYVIIGHNDTSIALNTDPPLTTIRENFEHISQAMIQHALALSIGSQNQSSTPVKPALIVRNSCGGRDRLLDIHLHQCEVLLDGVGRIAATPLEQVAP